MEQVDIGLQMLGAIITGTVGLWGTVEQVDNYSNSLISWVMIIFGWGCSSVLTVKTYVDMKEFKEVEIE